MKLVKKKISILIIIFLIVTKFLIYDTTADLIDESSLSDHNTINIDGNNQFNSTNGVVKGDGSENNPFLIENWSIEAEDYHGIWIKNTNAYFVIRNCIIFNGKNNHQNNNGIYLENVKNGAIENNRIFSNYHGIYLEDSDNNILSNNNCFNHSYGILLIDSRYNTLENNICFNNNEAINLDNSSYNKLEKNICSENKHTSIYLGDSSNNTIKNNVCLNQSFRGIVLSKSSHNILANNFCSKSFQWGEGIKLYSSSKNTLINNTLLECDDISLRISNLNIIKNNNCSKNSGISLEDSESNQIINNICINSSGISIAGSKFNTIKNNTCMNGKGIKLTGESNTIINNICTNTTGLLVEWGKYNNIINNSCTNGKGIILGRFSNFEQNNITGNICNFNDGDGISLNLNVEICEFNNISNNICHSNNENGIRISYSDNNLIFNNTCSNNTRSGISISSSDYNIISYNEILNNSFHGISCGDSSYNQLHHNYLKNNMGKYSQAHDSGSNNKWDAGYPSGGNYWFDYSGIDVKKGPDQNQSGNDGIGDTPYVIDENLIKDNYPLIILNVPIAPHSFQAIPGKGYIQLNWSTPIYDGGTNIMKYELYKGLEPENVTSFASVNKEILIYNDTEVINGQSYYYYITALNSIGESKRSNEVNATPNIGYKRDRDNDEIPDEWERKHGFNVTNSTDAKIDLDNDNLTNFEEYLNNTHPRNSDTDNDGLLDGDEIKIYYTNAANPDTDGDTYNDGAEIENGTNPLDNEDYPIEEDKDKEKDFEKSNREFMNSILFYSIVTIIIIVFLLIFAIIKLKPGLLKSGKKKEENVIELQEKTTRK